MRLFSLGILLMIGLAGCAAEAEAPAASTPTASASETAAEPVALSAEEIITASHDLFFAQGMTERVSSGGDNYILSYAPQEEFTAALYNETFDDVIAVSERGMFTVLAAYDLMSSGEAEISYEGNEITILSESQGSFVVEVADGLIVAGHEINDAWSGTFEYAPDQATLDLLTSAG